MPKLTVICYLCSLLFYGMGFSKKLMLNNMVIVNANAYNYSINVSMTIFFVLAIIFSVIGFLSFHTSNYRGQRIIEIR